MKLLLLPGILTTFLVVVASSTGLAETVEEAESQPQPQKKKGTVTLEHSTTFSSLRSNSHPAKASSSSSSCNDATNRDACFDRTDATTGEPCSWCVAGAVPSECVTQEQAALLPQGVFECSIPTIQTFAFLKTDSSDSNQVVHHTLKVKRERERRTNANDKDDYNDDEAFCDASSKSRSGYMDISGSKYDENGENKHLFFWMFEKRPDDDETKDDDDEPTPFIVWLTGGPGCSSTMALLTENGPCSVTKDGKGTVVNPYSWTETAHVLWLDQPAGVGFSYGAETDANEAMISEDVYYFLQAFMQTYPEYQTSPLYIVGESYAGHYVPAIGHRIYQGNQQLPDEDHDENNNDNDNDSDKLIKLNLAGISIGNGLTNPEQQYPYYPEMGVNNSHGIQIFDDTTYQTMKAVVPQCTRLIASCNAGDSFVNEFACQSAFLICNAGLTSPYQATGLNPYDIRIQCEKRPLCYDNANIEHWLNLPSTKQALGVDPDHVHSWETCNFGINMKFHSDWMHDFSKYVADLLDAGFPVLIYAGDVDFICNYLGNQAWTYNLEWSGTAGFQAATPADWNQGQGLLRTYKNFSFLQVYDAGHMVPMDQPKPSLDMIAQFVHGGNHLDKAATTTAAAAE